MPKRNLRIANPKNPLFGVCERCHTRFTSFAYNTEQAETEVKAAFDNHECRSSAGEQDNSGPRRAADES
jgi:hypothetical protein